MSTSEQINELVGALAKAQSEMENAPLDAQNPHFRSKYATLAAIRNATMPTLTKNGLVVFQTIDTADGGLCLVTRLAHTSGQWARSVYPLPTTSKPHEMGSALTYARRYSWAAITGIAAEEDDDGNAGQDAAKNGAPPPKRTRAEISEAANRKRQEFRDVTKDLLQIDSLTALDRYEREVLTPEFMAGLGQIQWSVEQKVGERRRELEDWQKAAEKEPTDEDARAEAEMRDEMIEHIQQTATEEDLLVWRESPDFRSDLASLPKPMQIAVRRAGATKLETLQKAAR